MLITTVRTSGLFVQWRWCEVLEKSHHRLFIPQALLQAWANSFSLSVLTTAMRLAGNPIGAGGEHLAHRSIAFRPMTLDRGADDLQCAL